MSDDLPGDREPMTAIVGILESAGYVAEQLITVLVIVLGASLGVFYTGAAILAAVSHLAAGEHARALMAGALVVVAIIAFAHATVQVTATLNADVFRGER